MLNTILSELTEEVQFEILQKIETKKVNKGQFLLEIGDVCTHLFFVQEGLLRTFCLNSNKDDVNIEFSVEGQFLTSIHSFYNNVPSLAGIECLEDSQLICIDRNTLLDLYSKYPELNKMGRIITEENFVRRELWHAIKFSMDSKERYETLLKDYPTLIKRVPLNHLSSYLGMTKEHLSRIRSQI